MFARLLSSSVVALAVAACLAATASADFAPVAVPGGGRAIEVAAAGDAWVVIALAPGTGSLGAWRSGDAGTSWQPVDVGDAPDELRVTAGPDGAFYLAERLNGTVRLLRLAPSASTPDEVPTGLAPRSDPHLAPPSWDAQGRMWLALVDSDDAGTSQLTVARVDGGAVAERATLTGVQTPSAGWSLDATAPAIFADFESDTYKLVDGALSDLGTEVGVPVLTDGGLTFMGDGEVSPDGGRTVAGDSGDAIVPVHGDANLLVTAQDVVARFSPTLFTATGLEVPGLVRSAWRTRGGLLVQDVPNSDGGPSLLFTPSIPALPAQIGAPAASSRTMVGRANALRRAAGLPPLADDALIAQAAAAHSAYWSKRRGPSNVLALHEETPGTAGFTGAEPWDRCKTAGTTCAAEVMYPGLKETRAVDGWAPTLFHGGLLTDPLAWRAGGAVAGHGPAVMDLGQDAGLVTGPVPFPSGRYAGALGYFGEAPDPGAACAKAHGPRIRPPYGPTMFLRLPSGGRATSFTVKRGGRGRALRGCLIAGSFVLDDPVRPRSTYAVTAQWSLSGGAPQTTSWTFRTRRR